MNCRKEKCKAFAPFGKTVKSLILLVVFSVFTLSFQPPGAAAAKLPLSLQVALYSKIFNYDKQLKGHKPALLIVTDSDQGKLVAKAFGKAGFNAKICTADQLPSVIGQADVIYVLSLSKMPQVTKTAQSAKKLLISANPADVKSGQAELSMGMKKTASRRSSSTSKPQIHKAQLFIAAAGAGNDCPLKQNLQMMADPCL